MKRTGLTLIETLICTVLLASLAAMTAGWLAASVRIAERASVVCDDSVLFHAWQTLIARDLANTSPGSSGTSPDISVDGDDLLIRTRPWLTVPGLRNGPPSRASQSGIVLHRYTHDPSSGTARLLVQTDDDARQTLQTRVLGRTSARINWYFDTDSSILAFRFTGRSTSLERRYRIP